MRVVALALLLVIAAHAARAGTPKPGPTPTFVDVTDRVGLTGLARCEAAWGDYNSDGWVDLYVGGQLWRNDAGQQFTRVADVSLQGVGIWGDYDNDGHADLFCWVGTGKLYRNNAGRGFEDRSDRLPELPMENSRGAVWGDFDGDGWLDLYVGGYEAPGYQPDCIYRNTCEGTFVKVWQTRGKPLPARGITAADFDEDGDLDIYVSNYRLVPNLLWRNNGRGVFADVARAHGVDGDGGLGAWGHTIGSAWGDLDNDGHLDLFAGNFSHSPAYQDRPKFYRNRGPKHGFRFEDRSKRAGLAWQESFASPTLGDFDNDGRLDMYNSTVYPRDHGVLYRNNGDWTFTNVTPRLGATVKGTYQAAWADYDSDGDLDLVTGGRLFRNQQRTGHWLKVRLRGDGRTVNRDAIGAQVRVRLGLYTLTRQVEGATGEGNQNDRALHLGLGKQNRPLQLTIQWPNGTSQTLGTRPDRSITVEYRAADQRGNGGNR